MARPVSGIFFLLGIFLLPACTPVSSPTPPPATKTKSILHTATLPASSPTATPSPIPPTLTQTPTATATPTPIPYADELKAEGTAEKLACRHGPGASYLYLLAFNKGAVMKLIGKADGNSWVLVENEPQRCWVNSTFLKIHGDINSLKPMYPDGYTIPISPYYGPTTILKASRTGEEITITWVEVPVSPGKYENENRFP